MILMLPRLLQVYDRRRTAQRERSAFVEIVNEAAETELRDDDLGAGTVRHR